MVIGELVLDVADATTCTGDVTVAPLAGLLTVTPANADSDPNKKVKMARVVPSLTVFRESLVKRSPRK